MASGVQGRRTGVPAAHPKPRPSVRLVALVAAGGAAGTLARYGVAEAVGTTGGWPTATFAVNLIGAFCLGLLLEALARSGEETVARRRLRLGLGTGFLGGFTTFSALAIEVERLWAAGQVGLGLAYGVVSVVAGVILASVGMVVVTRRGGAPA